MRDGTLAVNADLILAGLHHLGEVSILVATSEQVLELLSVKVFEAQLAIILDHEEAWVSHSLGWWQELAFLFNMFSVASGKCTWAVRLLAVDALDELVQIEGDTELLNGVSVSIDYEVVAFLVQHPELALS